MTYAVGKLEAALNISHLILSTSSKRVSKRELVSQSQLVIVSQLELVSFSQLVLQLVSQSWLVRVRVSQLELVRQSQLVRVSQSCQYRQTTIIIMILTARLYTTYLPEQSRLRGGVEPPLPLSVSSSVLVDPNDPRRQALPRTRKHILGFNLLLISITPWGEAQAVWSRHCCPRVCVFFQMPASNVTHDVCSELP